MPRIHDTDPFATPDADRSPVRRMRGRLATAVTLWTAGGDPVPPAGLTVSSTLVADGEASRAGCSAWSTRESEFWTSASGDQQVAVATLGPGTPAARGPVRRPLPRAGRTLRHRGLDSHRLRPGAGGRRGVHGLPAGRLP